MVRAAGYPQYSLDTQFENGAGTLKRAGRGEAGTAAVQTAKKRRVVLLTVHFPPGPDVGGLRAHKVARALQRSSLDVVVITARLPGESSAERPDTDGLRILTVPMGWSPRRWYAQLSQHLRRRRQDSPAAGTGTEEAAYTLPPRVTFLKRVIASLMWLPDDYQGFINPAVGVARPLLQPGDIVYTTAPPYSVHLAGLRLKSPGIRWVVEFRDPWTQERWKPWQVRTAFSDAIERWLERRVLRRADLVVGVSAGIRRLLLPQVGPDTSRLLLIRNGIADVATGSPQTRTGPFRIVHVGTFYLDRDPRPFLAGLALLRKQQAIDASRLRVQLVGQCRWFTGVSVEHEVERLGLGDLVEFRDWIPHDECQKLITGADALLLLAMRQPSQVPNKLYEYLGARVPILALADEDGESTLMLRQAGGHQVVTDEDPRAVATALNTLLRNRGVQAGGAILEEWTTQRQMGMLVKALETMA